MSNAPKKILGVVGDLGNAVTYVRFLQPFRHLREHGYELVVPDVSLELIRTDDGFAPDASIFDGVSMVIFPQMVLSPVLADGTRVDMVTPMCRMARERGIPIVYSPDDYLEEIEEGNTAYETITGSAANVTTLLEQADAFIVTTERLHSSLEPWDKPTWVLPNAIDPDCWPMRPRAGGEPSIGWSGSSSHIDDLLMVLPGIRELQKRVDVPFHILGLVDRPLKKARAEVRRTIGRLRGSRKVRAERFLDLTSQLRLVRGTHQPFGSLGDHFSRLAALDLEIGICPLEDTAFNRHKSALKYYEYAAVGTMTVASDVEPYLGELATTVANDPSAWADMLETYLCDERLRAEELERQREFVLGQRDIRRLNDAWAKALGEIRRMSTEQSTVFA